MGELEELYRRLVDRSPDGILLIQDARLVLVNPAAVRLLGAANDGQLLGRPLLDVFHADSHAAIRACLADISSSGATRCEATLLHVDGAVTAVEVAAASVEDSSAGSIQFVVRDITPRKAIEAKLRESEERLTLAFAGAQEGVFDWNLETGAVVYSARWKEMLGYADDEIEPHVSAWERVLHPDDRDRARALDLDLTRGVQTYEGEFRLRHKDGHYVHVLSRGLPVRREPGGPVVRIVGTHLDLSERKRVEELTRRTELHARLAFAQEDERRRIAREMHDQFGEQLTALELGIGMLKTACADQPRLRAHVEELQAVSRQLDSDIEHLVWELRPTALDDLGLRAALDNYVKNWSKRAGIRAELHTSGLLDDRLPSEAETTLYRIAQEALTNAAKHSRAQSVEVILERRGDQVVLIIEDDGVGFETGAVTAERRGFGLEGMNERAALGGASLEIESAVGQGTTILVRMASPMPSGIDTGKEHD